MEFQWCFRQASFVQGQGAAHTHGMPCNTGRAERFLGAGSNAFQRTWQSGEGGDDEVKVSDERGERRAPQKPAASLEGCAPRGCDDAWITRSTAVYSVDCFAHRTGLPSLSR